MHNRIFMKQTKIGFTLLEMLIVITIISILASIGLVSYTSFNKNSRDARRKADIEQIRAALELYRSNNGTYPLPAGTFGLAFGSGSLADTNNTYLSKIPSDPKLNLSYYYTSDASDYTLGALLEGISAVPAACSGTKCDQNDLNVTCNYCLGPYGEK